jgi:carboxyl-terminal processing protease
LRPAIPGVADPGYSRPLDQRRPQRTVYKPAPIPNLTLMSMYRRILVMAGGVLLGTILATGFTHSALFQSWFGGRELADSSAYVRDVLRIVNENYVDPDAVKYDELTKSALRGVVQKLDPHSEFMDAASYRAMEEEIGGKFGGIGVQVEQRTNGRIVVISPIADSPGERAGILRGDEIVGVDGETLAQGTALSEVVSRLRGSPDTKVSVRVYRPAADSTLDLSIAREVIKVESVRNVRVLPGGVGYLQITEFSRPSGEEFGKALEKLQAAGMTSLVLDLRNNPGGLLTAAVDVAERFFEKNELVVYTQGRKAGDREERRASGKRAPLKLPVAVLINSGSASAAEIVAGALKDTGRAVIVGERSFGKGSVQSIIPLGNGQGLRLTTARYYTPAGVSIHEVGVAPQVEVIMSPAEDEQLGRQRARPDITDPVEFRERFGGAPVVDRQLQAAVDVLTGLRAFDQRVAQVAPR